MSKGIRHCAGTAALIAVTIAVFGCHLEADAPASRAASAACPRLSEAANLALRPGGGRLRGDVDGDGRADPISIRYAPKARSSCGFLLVVETRSRVLSVRLPERYKTDLPIREWPFAEPFLAAVVQLDAHRSQIVVARSHGAAVVGVNIYGIAHGELTVLDFRPRFYVDELPLFGTVGTGDSNVRCVRGGALVFLNRGPTSAKGDRWFVRRSDYKLSQGLFRRTRTRMVTSSMKRAYALAHRWGMDALPFTGCIVARGRRL